jgi:hypothetical protein
VDGGFKIARRTVDTTWCARIVMAAGAVAMAQPAASLLSAVDRAAGPCVLAHR